MMMGKETPGRSAQTGHDTDEASDRARRQGWLAEVANAAAKDAGAPILLLGEYIDILADAALSGRRPRDRELAAVRRLGARAAEQGIDANQAVDLYLSAAWRLWQGIPSILSSPRERESIRAAAEAVLRVIADAVEALVEGHQAARRQMIRHEESIRRGLVDDLLRGDTDVSGLVQRAEPFGLDLSRDHGVLLAAPLGSLARVEEAALVLERAIVDRFGDRDVLIATKSGMLVMLVPGRARNAGSASNVLDPADFVHGQLSRHDGPAHWRVAAGRPYPGAYGIARSYEEAREAFRLADRLHLDHDVLRSGDLLAYRVLGRDQDALVDLVQDLLEPLLGARGGAEPLLQTLHAYFGSGTTATETARRLQVSVRTVTYRLARIAQLTGHNPADPSEHLGFHMAVVGARLLNWPLTAMPNR